MRKINIFFSTLAQNSTYMPHSSLQGNFSTEQYYVSVFGSHVARSALAVRIRIRYPTHPALFYRNIYFSLFLPILFLRICGPSSSHEKLFAVVVFCCYCLGSQNICEFICFSLSHKNVHLFRVQFELSSPHM